VLCCVNDIKLYKEKTDTNREWDKWTFINLYNICFTDTYVHKVDLQILSDKHTQLVQECWLNNSHHFDIAQMNKHQLKQKTDIIIIKCNLLSQWFIVFSVTFSNISAISCRPVLVMKETGVPRENHRLWASNWQSLSFAVASRVHPFL
jgi:hypothetical protein